MTRNCYFEQCDSRSFHSICYISVQSTLDESEMCANKYNIGAFKFCPFKWILKDFTISSSSTKNMHFSGDY